MQRVVAFLQKKGIKVWLDKTEIPPGSPIWEIEIEKAIKETGAVVVLLSPDANASVWVRRELSYAERYKKRVFPLLVAGDEHTIMLRLATNQYIDIRKNESEDRGLNSLTTAIGFHLEDLAKQEASKRKEAEEEQAKRDATKKAEYATAQETLEKAEITVSNTHAQVRDLIKQLETFVYEKSVLEKKERLAEKEKEEREKEKREISESIARTEAKRDVAKEALEKEEDAAKEAKNLLDKLSNPSDTLINTKATFKTDIPILISDAKEQENSIRTKEIMQEKQERTAIPPSIKTTRLTSTNIFLLFLSLIASLLAFVGGMKFTPTQTFPPTPPHTNSKTPTLRIEPTASANHISTQKAGETAAANATSTARAKETMAIIHTSTAKADATATARAIAIDYAQSTENTNYFYEDFSDNSNEWLTGSYSGTFSDGSRSISDNVYIWDITEVKNTFEHRLNTPNSQTLKSFHLSVDAKAVSAHIEDYCYGIYFNRTGVAYYLLSVCGSQEYKFSYYDGDQWDTIIEETYSAAIYSKDWNRIEVFADNNHFEFYINNTKINELDDSRLDSGHLGVAIGVHSKETGQVRFDNFLLEVRE